MTKWIKRVKNEGISLRLTFIFMLFISIAVTSILLITTYNTFLSFHSLSDSTDTYIELQDAAAKLLSASDYLTDEARSYVVLGDRVHLDNYFTEAEITRRREQSIETIEKHLPDSDALIAIKQALSNSVQLMDREYYSMMLVLDATNDTNIPDAMAEIQLSAEDKALSSSDKMRLAQTMMYDDIYTKQKDAIRSDLNVCIGEIKNATHAEQSFMNRKEYHNLIYMAVLILIQSIGLILMLILTTKLGINPIIQAVDHIRQDQRLPIIGAHEFRYLAGAYNKMYSAYKKSIDQLSFKASHDELTKVYNRSGYDLIKDSIDTTSTALLLFDADQFKSINDNYGHEVGDLILKKIANALQQNFRPDDYIFRIGGDEFIVFMVHVNNNVSRLIENKIIQINKELSNTSDNLPPISLSAGISLSDEKREPQQMFREADTALYYVKDNGRSGCCFYKKEMRTID